MAESKSSYKISSYAKFLLKLACELKPGDLERMKLVLAVEDRLFSGKRERIKTAAELFVHLQQIGLLGQRNVSFFEEVFPAIGREDLLVVISDYRQLWETPNEVPVLEMSSGEYALMTAAWEMRDNGENDVFGEEYDNQSQSSSHSRLSSLSDDEKLDIAKRQKKKVKRKRTKSSSSSHSSISKLLAKLKL